MEKRSNNKNKCRALKLLWAFLLLTISTTSCKKLVDIPPPTQTLAENKVYATDATAIGVLDGIYTSLTIQDYRNFFQGNNSIGLLAGLSADEFSSLTSFNPYTSFFKNDLGVNIAGSDFWAPLYNQVYKCNAAIEGLAKSTTLNPLVKQQLLGEAKFLRGFFLFLFSELIWRCAPGFINRCGGQYFIIQVSQV